MCSANEQLKMRQVCQHWEGLHDRYFAHPCRIYQLKVAVANDKLYLYGLKARRDILLSLPRNRKVVKRFLEITELIYNKRNLQSGTIILENEAACDYVLHLLAQRKWNIRNIELHGVALNVSAKKLCEFLAMQSDNPAVCNVELFVITNGIVSPGFISERLLNALQKSGTTFDIELDESCAESFYHNSLTDDALERILRPNARYNLSFPYMWKISPWGIEKALKKYLATDWSATLKGSYFETVDSKMNPIRRYGYGCELRLQANSRINLTSVIGIKIDNVELQRRHCPCICHFLNPRDMEEKYGRVCFKRRIDIGKSVFIDVVFF
uniref:F-box domain-containing protein n=1 Tax=Syphacia muris TaxID=451379 RepID=A0A0N5A835_9BILA